MINYKIIQDSIDYYSQIGFERIESPWAVSAEVANITKPEGKTNFIINHNDKALVASGEQSFLYLYLKGFLPKGCYQTVTPCFRYENFDILHTKYFIKNELIDTKNVHMQRVEDILNLSLYFFQKYLPDSKIVKTKIGYDYSGYRCECGTITTSKDLICVSCATKNKRNDRINEILKPRNFLEKVKLWISK